jgi:ABC-type antimicrobial peptide transport system permease subunit
MKGENPIGKIMRTHPEPGYPATNLEIVGIVADSKYGELRDDAIPSAFVPVSQSPSPGPGMALVIYSPQNPAKIIEAFKSRMTERFPLVRSYPFEFERMIMDRQVRERLMALLSGFFGGLAALLAMIGLYGVISFMVTRRRNEIGIRVALGAHRGQVVRMILGEAVWMVAAGVVIGSVLSLAAARGATSLLFGLKPNDPLTYVAAALVMGLIALLASVIPAHRAAKQDPMVALRSE